MPLVYRHLSETCPEVAQSPALKDWRSQFSQHVVWNLFLTGELSRILSFLEAHGICAIPFRGPTLAAWVYGDLSLRQFKDLDVLVHQGDVPQAKELLRSLGYHPKISLSGVNERAFLRFRTADVLVHESNRNMVDLQWQIIDRFFLSFNPDELWNRIEWRRLGGRQVPGLAPADLLMLLCVHGDAHIWERLGWLCDIALFLETHPALDWEQVAATAARQGWERRLLLALRLAHDLLGATVPEKLRRQVEADPLVDSLSQKVRHWLLGGDENGPNFIETLDYYLKGRERLRDKLRLFGTIFTPNAAELERWPSCSAKYNLFYFLRPFLLFGRHVLKIKNI
jgi:hypothetical protein